MGKRNIVITGLPGSGKTTLIRKVAAGLMPWGPLGFYTAEMREGGVRMGFELVSLQGPRRTLAHVLLPGRDRIGKYGVDVKGFEEFLETLTLQNAPSELIVIDEIGRMECLSPRFIDIMRGLLDSDKVVLASVALKGEGLIRDVKMRHDTDVFEIGPVTRDRVCAEIQEKTEEALRMGVADGEM
jgi:nucleoside-triphosphatase